MLLLCCFQARFANVHKLPDFIFVFKVWYGEGGGRRVQDGEHMYTCGGFISIKKKNKVCLWILLIIW